jgi:hypothetical protein
LGGEVDHHLPNAGSRRWGRPCGEWSSYAFAPSRARWPVVSQRMSPRLCRGFRQKLRLRHPKQDPLRLPWGARIRNSRDSIQINDLQRSSIAFTCSIIANDACAFGVGFRPSGERTGLDRRWPSSGRPSQLVPRAFFLAMIQGITYCPEPSRHWGGRRYRRCHTRRASRLRHLCGGSPARRGRSFGEV